jgi:hypothetical protein
MGAVTCISAVNDTEPLLLSVTVVGDGSAAPHAIELALAAATTARQSTSLTPPLLQFKRGDVNPTVGGSSAVESKAKPPTHASRRCSLDEKGLPRTIIHIQASGFSLILGLVLSKYFFLNTLLQGGFSQIFQLLGYATVGRAIISTSTPELNLA